MYPQEDGRVLIRDYNSFFAEVTDDGNALSVTQLKNYELCLRPWGFGIRSEYENAIKIDDTVADLDIFGFSYFIGDTVSNLGNFEYNDGNLESTRKNRKRLFACLWLALE